MKGDITMKLATALSRRKELQTHIHELENRLMNNAQVQEGDTLTLGDKTYLFRRAELYYYHNQPVYQWGLCVEKGVNDTWASQS